MGKADKDLTAMQLRLCQLTTPVLSLTLSKGDPLPSLQPFSLEL